MPYDPLVSVSDRCDLAFRADHVYVQCFLVAFQHAPAHIALERLARPAVEVKHFGATLVVDCAVGGQPVDRPARNAALLHADFCVLAQFHMRTPVCDSAGVWPRGSR